MARQRRPGIKIFKIVNLSPALGRKEDEAPLDWLSGDCI
jgi:hypothetical protein